MGAGGRAEVFFSLTTSYLSVRTRGPQGAVELAEAKQGPARAGE
jgi:hypothetical protein